MSEFPAIYEDSEHRARKTHTCSDCGVTINPGSLYFRVAILPKSYGKWQHFKQCSQCNKKADYDNIINSSQ